jgi:hypothetical protein
MVLAAMPGGQRADEVNGFLTYRWSREFTFVAQVFA